MLDVGVTISHGGASATICPFCGAGCSALLVDGTAYPRLHHPISQGALRLRGWSMGGLAR